MPKGVEHYNAFRADLRTCTNKFTRRRSSLKGLMDHMWKSRTNPVGFKDRADALRHCSDVNDKRIPKYHAAIDRMVTCWGTQKPYPAVTGSASTVQPEKEAEQHAKNVLAVYAAKYLPMNKKGLDIGGFLFLPDPTQPLGAMAQKDDQFIVLLGEQHGTDTPGHLEASEKLMMIAGAKQVVQAIGKGGPNHTTLAAVELPIGLPSGSGLAGSGAGTRDYKKIPITSDSDKHLGSINHSLFFYKTTLLAGVTFVKGEDTDAVIREGLGAKSDERNEGIADHLTSASDDTDGASLTVLPVGLSHLGVLTPGGKSIQGYLEKNGWTIVQTVA